MNICNGRSCSHFAGNFRGFTLSLGLPILLAIAILVFVNPLKAISSIPVPTNSDWTPVVVSTLTPKAEPILGTDGKYHVVYELELTNTIRIPATIQQLEVVNGSNPAKVIATYNDKDWSTRLRTLGNSSASTPEIEFNGSRLFLIDLSFDYRRAVPSRLLHHFQGQLASVPSPSLPAALNYTVAPVTLTSQIPIIGPPLAGKGWIAINGCCAPNVGHRSTGLPVNGGIHFAQRFAIDWVKLDAQGRVVNGDVSNVKNYVGYGANVLAVAEGTVVDIFNTLFDQTPPNSPDPGTITLQNVLGNHVILDLGNSVFVLYAHLQKGSVTVKLGKRVRRGQVLGKLGNTGNTSAPHLHFHMMTGPTLGSEGIPYKIERFNLAGQIPAAVFDFPEGEWNKYLLPQPSSRRDEFPLYLAIVDFPD